MDLKNKKVAVVGLGKSGMAAAALLSEKGAQVSISECAEDQRIKENIRNLKNKDIRQLELGRHTRQLITDQDLLVISPGVPLDSLPILWARQKGIPIIGEIELAFNFCPAPIIAITGTNGKTTVTTLVGEILQQANKKHVVCGNIGNPFSRETSRLTDEHIVILEVSSFQLETIERFKPHIAIVLNLTDDHLDRYPSMQEYFLAKNRIFANQSKLDWAILNKEDPYCLAMAKKTKAKVRYFPQNGVQHKLQGFNSNCLAALAAGSLLGVDEDIAINVCRNFKGVEHRLEKVAEIEGREFINDSKATNVDSTLWALNSINKPVILIAGGRDKNSDFSAIREKLRSKVRTMILIGEAKEKIRQSCADLLPIETCANLAEAVQRAFLLARAGDCVLLSPMCASFDMFSDYAERGRVFKQAVADLR